MERERAARRRVALIGRPNVGKSSIMHALTGRRVTISNYPGTTVEVVSGYFRLGSMTVEVVDTPGVYSLGQPLEAGYDITDYERSEEQKVTSSLIASSAIDLIVMVADASDLERHLPLVIEVLHLKIPVIVALNQMDRAEMLGLCPDVRTLEEALGVRVVPVSASVGRGIERLRACMVSVLRRGTEGEGPKGVSSRISAAERIATEALRTSAPASARSSHSTSARSGKAFEVVLDDPYVGIAASLAIIYLSFVAIVGLTRMGEMLLGVPLLWVAEYFTTILFELGPLRHLVGTSWAEALRAGVREGMLLPVSVVMPAMIGVYVVLAVLEDSGLLARLTVSGERLMNLIDLPGEAAVPLILAFGCRAPAVLASRTVPGSRFRQKTMTFICLGIPCGASVAMTSAMIAQFDADPVVVWGSVGLGFVFLAFMLRVWPGFVDPYLRPHYRPSASPVPVLATEIPPLRMPAPANVSLKTWVRMSSFFEHVLPMLFIVGFGARALLEVGIWKPLAPLGGCTSALFGVQAATLTGVMFTAVQKYLAPAILLTLPLGPREAAIAAVMSAVSVPCLPVSIIVSKESGIRYLVKVWLIGAMLSLGAGLVLNIVLPR
ncbi:MAG TPA: ferrous iron transporter B [Clostridia bacterium]|nr:ferrous iron transporter B [Clostridia bacterium]